MTTIDTNDDIVKTIIAKILNGKNTVTEIEHIDQRLFGKHRGVVNKLKQMAAQKKQVNHYALALELNKPFNVILENYVELTTSPLEDLVAMLQEKQLLNELRSKVSDITTIEEAEALAADIQARADDILIAETLIDMNSYFSQYLIIVKNRIEEFKTGIFKSRLLTGYKAFDNIFGGFRKGNLICIASRSGNGKTTFALNIVAKQIINGNNCAMLSLETGQDILFDNLAGIIAKVQKKKISEGRLTKEELQRVSGIVTKMLGKFYVETRQQSKNKLRRFVATAVSRGAELIVIDHLGLIPKTASENNVSQNLFYSEVTAELKRLANEFEVPIILVQQQNRLSDRSRKEAPKLSDLMYGGEQDYDIVLSLERDFTDEETAKRLVVHVLKNRHGAQNITVNLDFALETGGIYE